LRVGIQPEDTRRVGNLSDFVLGTFGREERAVVVDLLPRLQDAIEIWLREGILKAMNAHNGEGRGPATQ
jgi:peptidyl-tRNA hydrolase